MLEHCPEYNLSNPGGAGEEPSYFQIQEQHRLKMLACFRHPPALMVTIKQSCVARGQ